MDDEKDHTFVVIGDGKDVRTYVDGEAVTDPRIGLEMNERAIPEVVHRAMQDAPHDGQLYRQARAAIAAVAPKSEKTSPGPWKACSASNGKCACGTVWSIPRDMPVATAHYKSSEDGEGDTPLEEMAANAALIASAPTLRDQRDRAVELLRYIAGFCATGAEHFNYPVCGQCFECRRRALLAEVGKEST